MEIVLRDIAAINLSINIEDKSFREDIKLG